MRNSTLMSPMLVLYAAPPLFGRLASFFPPLLVVTLSHYLHSSTFAAPSLSLFHSSCALSLFHLHSLVIFYLLSVKPTTPPPPHTYSSTLPFLFLLQNFAVGQLIIFPQTCYFYKENAIGYGQQVNPSLPPPSSLFPAFSHIGKIHSCSPLYLKIGAG